LEITLILAPVSREEHLPWLLDAKRFTALVPFVFASSVPLILIENLVNLTLLDKETTKMS